MSISSNQPLNTNQLPISLDVNPDEDHFYSILLLYLRRIANAVNTKESGLYLLQEVANFEQWFTLNQPGTNRDSYRLTADLVALNGGPIGAGTTPLKLEPGPIPPATQPIPPDGYLYPVHAWGGALDTSGVSYFINDPLVYVRYTASTNTISITNNTGKNLTWAVWSMSYLKT